MLRILISKRQGYNDKLRHLASCSNVLYSHDIINVVLTLEDGHGLRVVHDISSGRVG